MRIWQAGKKREALRIGYDPMAPSINAMVLIGGEIAVAAEIVNAGLYTGRVMMADGREFEYESNSF